MIKYDDRCYEGDKIFISDVEKNFGITVQDVLNKVTRFNRNIANELNVKLEYVNNLLINKFSVTMSKLADLVIIPHGMKCGYERFILLKENALHRIISERYDYKTCSIKKEWYDVYLVEDEYAHLLATRVIEYILGKKYPNIFKNPAFTKKIKRFNNTGLFSITNDTRLIDLSTMLRDGAESIIDTDYMEYTVADLIDVLSKKISKDTESDESLFNIYYTPYVNAPNSPISIYFELTKDISLTIPLQAIQNKDWKLVEEAEVYSIRCYGDEKRWYNGKQVDAPYFNYPLVESLKKTILIHK